MRLDSLYQEIILDHYKHPHGRGLREPYDAEVHHVNPTCGDEVTLPVVVSSYLPRPQTVELTLADAPWFERTGSARRSASPWGAPRPPTGSAIRGWWCS